MSDSANQVRIDPNLARYTAGTVTVKFKVLQGSHIQIIPQFIGVKFGNMSVLYLPSADVEGHAGKMSETAIRYFLSKVNVAIPLYAHDTQLNTRVRDIVVSWNIPKMMGLYSWAVILAETAYGHLTDTDAKVHIALLCCIMLALDEPAFFDSQQFNDLHEQICSGVIRSESSVCGRMMQVLRGMWSHFSQFSASAIFSSTLQFLNISLLENNTEDISKTSKSFASVEYRRSLTGVAEAYTFFIWEKANFPDASVYFAAIPDVCLYINYVNDILSFYKEELEGETGTYITERARVAHKSVEETLCEVIDDTSAVVERIRTILGEGKVRDAWESFAGGYVNFYLLCPRYRLQELVNSPTSV